MEQVPEFESKKGLTPHGDFFWQVFDSKEKALEAATMAAKKIPESSFPHPSTSGSGDVAEIWVHGDGKNAWGILGCVLFGENGEPAAIEFSECTEKCKDKDERETWVEDFEGNVLSSSVS